MIVRPSNVQSYCSLTTLTKAAVSGTSQASPSLLFTRAPTTTTDGVLEMQAAVSLELEHS